MNLNSDVQVVKIGLLLVMLTLIFGIGMGVVFGIEEDAVKSFISEGVDAHADLHDGKSKSKIWRYAQRSHFHATGIAAFSIGLVLLVMISSLQQRLKKIAAILIGLGGVYPLAWFSMFLLAPSLGRDAAHHHIVTVVLTYVGVGSLLLGMALLCANLFFEKFQDES